MVIAPPRGGCPARPQVSCVTCRQFVQRLLSLWLGARNTPTLRSHRRTQRMRAGTCASTPRTRRTSKRFRGERGAALVEFAILLPLVMLITFGVIEFSAAYQSSSIATASARTAARTASAEALLSTYATDAATAAATALRTAPSDEPQEMWIYRANAQGLPESGGFSTCTTHCISYQWN